MHLQVRHSGRRVVAHQSPGAQHQPSVDFGKRQPVRCRDKHKASRAKHGTNRAQSRFQILQMLDDVKRGDCVEGFASPGQIL